ncbi:MAG: hypothetical protein ACTSU8_05745 [Alphaproteobacteria bacterium]
MSKAPARVRKVRAAVTIGFPHPKKNGAGELVQAAPKVIATPSDGNISEQRAALKERKKAAGKTRVDKEFERVEIWNSDGIQASGHFITLKRAEKRIEANKEAAAHNSKRVADDAAFAASEATKTANAALEKAKALSEKADDAGKALKSNLKDAGMKAADVEQPTAEEKQTSDNEARDAELAKANKIKEAAEAKQQGEKNAAEAARKTVGNENAKWEEGRRSKLKEAGESGSTGSRKAFTDAGRAKLRNIAVKGKVELGGNEQAGELIEKIIAHETAGRVEKLGSDSERIGKILGKK